MAVPPQGTENWPENGDAKNKMACALKTTTGNAMDSDMESWLWKRYPLPTGRWKRVFCTYHGHLLRCYTDETHRERTGEFCLGSHSSVSEVDTAEAAMLLQPQPYGFAVLVRDGHGKPVHFCTNAAAIRRHWVGAITHSAQGAHDSKCHYQAALRRSLKVPSLTVGATRRLTSFQQPTGGSPAKAKDNICLRGLSVDYINTVFVEEVKKAGLGLNSEIYIIEPKVIRPKGATTICPRDQLMGAAYVDCVETGHGAGKSTHMLSYTWGYSIKDIAEGLTVFCRKEKVDPQQAVFWMCCCCINQHRVKQGQEPVPFEQFRIAFATRVQSIGHVVALMTPWNDPQYTKRVWCVFEMFTAVTLGSRRCRISITMPLKDESDMHQSLATGRCTHLFWKALLSVKIEEAQASVEADRKCIFQLLQDAQTDGSGFHSLNSAVAKCLQDWVKATCNERLQDEIKNASSSPESVASLSMSLGSILTQIGDLQLAATVLDRGCRHLRTKNSLDSHTGATLLTHVGITRGMGGDPASALQAFKQAKNIFITGNCLETADGACLLAHLAKAKGKVGKLQDEIEILLTAKGIREKLGELNTPDGAMLMRHLGDAFGRNFDPQTELQTYRQALEIHNDIGTLETPEGAVLMRHIGQLLGKEGDLEGEIDALEEAKRIRERTGTLDTPGGAGLLKTIGMAKEKQIDFFGALEAYEKSQSIHENTRTLETSSGIELMARIVAIKARLGKRVSGAKRLLASVRQHTLTDFSGIDDDEVEEEDDS